MLEFMRSWSAISEFSSALDIVIRRCMSGNPWDFRNHKTEMIYRRQVYEKAASHVRLGMSIALPMLCTSRGLGLWIAFEPAGIETSKGIWSVLALSHDPNQSVAQTNSLVLVLAADSAVIVSSIYLLVLVWCVRGWQDQQSAGRQLQWGHRVFVAVLIILVYASSFPAQHGGLEASSLSIVNQEKFAFLMMYSSFICSMTEHSFVEAILFPSLLVCSRLGAALRSSSTFEHEQTVLVMLLVATMMLYFKYALARETWLKDQATATFNVIFDEQLQAPILEVAGPGCDEYYTTKQWSDLAEVAEAEKANILVRGVRNGTVAEFGPYRISTQIVGHGAWGIIYGAVNRATKERLAVKRCDLSVRKNQAEQNLMNESVILSAIRHPNIVLWKSSVFEHGSLLLFLEFCDGGTLQQLLEKGPLDVDSARKCTFQLVRAVQYLHQICLAHRDIKPGNILFAGGVLKLADFGSAKWMLKTSSKLSSSIAGTRLYLPPEIFMGSAWGRKVDIWAVGCCVIEMMTLERVGESFYGQHGPRGPDPQQDWYSKPVRIGQYLSPDSEGFARLCLVPNPKFRANSQELLEHEFICGQSFAALQLDAAPWLAGWDKTQYFMSIGYLRWLSDACSRLDGNFRNPDTEREFQERMLKPQLQVLMLPAKLVHCIAFPFHFAAHILPRRDEDLASVFIGVFVGGFTTVFLFLIQPRLSVIQQCYGFRALSFLSIYADVVTQRSPMQILYSMQFILLLVFFWMPLARSVAWILFLCVLHVSFSSVASISTIWNTFEATASSFSAVESRIVQLLVLILVLGALVCHHYQSMKINRGKFLRSRKLRSNNRIASVSRSETSDSSGATSQS